MKTISRSNKHILALVLAVALVLTAIFGLLAISHSKAASPASLEEKKAGWYAVRSGAVDLSCNGVLQNKYGSWFVEDGRVNFGYTGWLVCEGTYYYVTSGKADKPASLPVFAIPKTKSNIAAGTNNASNTKGGNSSNTKGINAGTQASNGTGKGSASNSTKNSNSGAASNETKGSNASSNATNPTNKQPTKAPATTKTAATTKKASTTKKATTKPTTKKPSTKTLAQPQTQPTSSDIPVTMDEDELPIIAD